MTFPYPYSVQWSQHMTRNRDCKDEPEKRHDVVFGGSLWPIMVPSIPIRK